jgi:hypothetical protein
MLERVNCPQRMGRGIQADGARKSTGAVDHPTDNEIKTLTLGEVATAESIRLQRHIYHCSDCLRRLIEADLLLVIADTVMRRAE